MLRYAGEHARTNLFAVVKREDEISGACAGENPV